MSHQKKGESVIDLDYEAGSYLKDCDDFVISPLSPGIGNAHLRSCKLVVVRFYMGTTAVELGCTFRGQDMVQNIPVLRLNFPKLGRVNKNFRLFRVKVVSGVDAQICILSAKAAKTLGQHFGIYDFSTKGLGFELPTSDSLFEVGETISFKVQVAGISDVELNGMVRQVSKVRDSKGAKIVCGIQFDLETQAMASQMERIAAAIQRLQLREIAERTADKRGVRIMK